MLNSTKTWREEFKNKFPDKIARVIDDFGDTTKSDLEQFISDLRKRDMEALIGMLPKMDIPKHRDYHHPDNISYTLGDVKAEKIYTRNNIEKLIKEYYEN